MQLRDLLADRAAINLLKFLFDMESGERRVYSIETSNIKQRFPSFKDIDNSIGILKSLELINEDYSEKGQIVSISAKGKQFIDIFDKLVQITDKNYGLKAREKAKSFKIEYNLTPKEKRIMVVVFKLSRELGNKPVSLQDLTQEIYPTNSASKKSGVARHVSKLNELNLIEKQKINNKNFLKLTPTGERTIKEQLIEALL